MTANNIYYDANIVNNSSKPIQLTFNDIRTSTILDDPSLYEIAVIRYNLETCNSIPVWIPSIPKQNPETYDPYLTSYTFKLVYEFENQRISSGDINVKYIQSDFTVSPPLYSESKQGSYNLPFYHVRSFNAIVDMFNDCLAYAMLNLQYECDAVGVTLPSYHAPFFEWNSEKCTFILNGDDKLYDANSTYHVSIYCNSLLYNLMSGFQADKYATPDGNEEYKFKMQKDIRELNIYVVDDSGYQVIQVYQEYSSGSLFTPVSSVMFTSTQIPVLPSMTSLPTIYGGNNNGLTSSGLNNNTANMITDFQSQDNIGYGFQSNLSYVPSSEYRMISLNGGSGKINSIDISCFWKDKYANIHPVFLNSGMACDIKILFRKIKAY